MVLGPRKVSLLTPVMFQGAVASGQMTNVAGETASNFQTAPASAKPYAIKPSLLRPWDGKFSPSRPFVAQYRNKGKQLSYVASFHESRLESETFRLIKDEFFALKPQIVIIEGSPTAEGLSPKRYSKDVKQNLNTKLWKNGESIYSAALAYQNKVPFIGGEPTDAEITECLRKMGYSDKDMLGYYLLRYIPVWRRKNPEKKLDLEWFVKNYAGWFIKDYSLNKTSEFASAKEFIEWYKKKNRHKFDLENCSTNLTAPVIGPRALFTQRLSAKEDKLRDAHITSLIAEMLNKYDRVMIVYGCSHIYQQELVLKDMLGEPQISRLADARDRSGGYSGFAY